MACRHGLSVDITNADCCLVCISPVNSEVNMMKDQHQFIKGYRDLTETEIEAINEIKTYGTMLGDLVEKLRSADGLDQRWVSIGATDLQTGLMALIRAIAQPTLF